MTLVILGIDQKTGEAHYRNAGHTPLMWMNNRINTVIEGGSPLGFDAIPNLGRRQFRMQEGDRIFIYSDGLVSNRTGEGKKITWKVLSGKLREFAEPEDLIAELRPFVDNFIRDRENDDTACIALHFLRRG